MIFLHSIGCKRSSASGSIGGLARIEIGQNQINLKPWIWSIEQNAPKTADIF
jgi:hypothetical protein